MLFNSFQFIFLFLPLVLIAYKVSTTFRLGRAAIAALVLSSLFYYAYWSLPHLSLLVVSIGLNFGFGLFIEGYLRQSRRRAAMSVAIFGIVLNLSSIAFFKYGSFLVENVSILIGSPVEAPSLILPLGISFFTFQQIAYLADVYRYQRAERNLANYALFVSFFPQLIAGPIVHHMEMLPQFARTTANIFRASNVAVGASIFILGFFKKVVIADGIAVFSSPVFDAAAQGGSPHFIEAWGAALAYTFQIYFDFSGYSDMAIGAARMFGIQLPVNFYSPYRSTNITEFWRTWHMTLSRFLRDYLYIPLGGSRRGTPSRYINLMVTMLLGGLWHGAGWTFIIWGGLHGLFLVIHHAWRHLWRKTHSQSQGRGKYVGRLVTFSAVGLAWVLFRADTLDAALLIYGGMIGLHGVELPFRVIEVAGPFGAILLDLGVKETFASASTLFQLVVWLGALLTIVWFAPNTYEIFQRYRPGRLYGTPPHRKKLRRAFSWRPTGALSVIWSLLFFIACFMLLSGKSEFLYYQF